MRIAKVIFVGSMAALVMVSAPAKNIEAQKSGDKSTPSPCHAYQQAEDGSWRQAPCQEFGNGQTLHKPVAKSAEEEPR